MGVHTALSRRTDTPVYGCDPCSPWQRGANENPNGLGRHYPPKDTGLSGDRQAQLDAMPTRSTTNPGKAWAHASSWRSSENACPTAHTTPPPLTESQAVALHV